MEKKQSKIFFFGMIIVVIAIFFYVQDKDTLFTQFTSQFSDVNWDEVKEVDIVKNSVPIILLEDQGDQCIVNANAFELIIDHQYFVRSSDLIRELNYDRESSTLTIACDMLVGEKSRLHVWYALEEAEKHAEKYEYFVTVWEET